MNPASRLRYNGYDGDPTRDPGCGRLALQNAERYWWQSRMTRAGQPAELPDLADLPALARAIRQGPPPCPTTA